MVRIQECVLYRDFQHGEILEKMTALMNACESGQEQLKEQENTFFECMNGLVEMAGSYGFSGNLWHNYLTFLLVNHENAFSTASEIRGAVEGSINELARKSKTAEGLTDAEKEEQQMLRRIYIDSFKANLRAQLDNIEFVDDDKKVR